MTANFAINTFTLNYTAGAGGTLTGETSQTVNYGEDGTAVTAVANTGYHFVNWSDGSTVNPRTDTNVTANVAVTANFAINTFTLAVVSDHGTITKAPDQATYTYGTEVLLTMGVVDAGWTFTGWSGGGCTGTAPCTVTMNADTTVTANFTQNAYILTVNSAHGAVTKEPDQTTYTYGTEVLLTMGAEDPGWTFTGWSGGGCMGIDPCTVTMNADTTVTANFAINTFSLTYAAGAGGSLTGETSQTVNYGEDGTPVDAVANTGYHFVNWSDGSTVNPRTDTNVTADVAVTANFAINTFSLTTLRGRTEA